VLDLGLEGVYSQRNVGKVGVKSKEVIKNRKGCPLAGQTEVFGSNLN
jgi:hypothetical protein